MKECYQLRRQQSYYLNCWDDVNLSCQYLETDLDQQIISQFVNKSELIYPAKSYFVAIVYAACFEKWFDEDFYKVLDDVELLPDDQFFKPYSCDKLRYDYVIQQIGDIWKYQSIDKTVVYFKQEFLICS